MCGRFTRNYTWAQIHALYRLTALAAIPNFQPRFNVCPTDPVDTVVAYEDVRELVEMRWGLVPYWWYKPLKDSATSCSARLLKNSPVPTKSAPARSWAKIANAV